MKKFIRPYLALLLAILWLVGCARDPEVLSNVPSILSTEVSEITSSSVVLRAEAENVGSAQCGFVYGTDISLSDAREIVGEADDNGFSSCLMGLQPLTTYYYSTYVKRNDSVVFGDVKTFTTDEQIKLLNAVDLGISIKWADVNLGASTPEQIGDLYAWGETEPKNVYTWDNYSFYEGQEGWFSKYQVPVYKPTRDFNIVLNDYDDAAHCVAGSDWRTPTVDDWLELQEECDWNWVDSYEGTGVSGYVIRGRKPGYTSNYIFLPKSKTVTIGSKRAYWSSSLDYTSGIDAYCYSFNSDTVAARKSGLPIRAVIGSSRKIPVDTIVCTPSPVIIKGLFQEAKIKISFVPANVRCSEVEIAFSTSSGMADIIDYSDGVCTIASRSYGATELVISSIDGGSRYSYQALRVPIRVVEDESDTILSNFTVSGETADLGLSVLWSNSNLRARSFAEAGQVFSWGETISVGEYDYDNPNLSTGKKTDYVWNEYKHARKRENTLTKYCTSALFGDYDGLTVLEPGDDAAHVVLGEGWRTPTVDEWKELLDNCTVRYVMSVNGQQLSGYLCTSKVPGHTDKSIFIIKSDYWTANVDVDDPNYAKVLYTEDNIKTALNHRKSRSSYASVRPVKDK